MNESDEIDLSKKCKMLFDKKKTRKGDVLIGLVYDSVFETMNWANTLPYLQFPACWQIKIIPPFDGVIIRFKVKKATTPPNKNISIYFDGYNNLGCVGEPYWEIYADVEGQTSRFALGQEEEMFLEIEKALEELEKE